MKNILLKNNRGPALSLSKGFTLIETLVALSIFTVSIVGLISVTGTGVGNTNFAKQKFIASYLAQEGIEMVRNIRDTTLLSGGDWNQFITNISGCTNLATGCMIESTNLTVVACAPDCWPLEYDSATGFYTYESGSDSNFTRKITVEDYGGTTVNVTSEVVWLQGSVAHSTSYAQMLMDWIQPSDSGPPLE